MAARPEPRKYLLAFHGFNVGDSGASTIDRLRPYAEAQGYRWIDGDYGWRGLLGVAIANPAISGVVAAVIEGLSLPSDYLVIAGHSNGAAIAARITHQWCPTVRQLLLINPALADDWFFPVRLDAVHVFGARTDFWTRVSKLAPGSVWGDLGNGYEGDQPDLVHWHNMSSHPRFAVRGHSEVFKGEASRYWLDIMMHEVESTRRKRTRA